MTRPIGGFDLDDAEELGKKIVSFLGRHGMFNEPDSYTQVGLAMMVHGLSVQGAQLAGVLADHGDEVFRSVEGVVNEIIRQVVSESFKAHYALYCQEKALKAIQQAAAKEV